MECAAVDRRPGLNLHVLASARENCRTTVMPRASSLLDEMRDRRHFPMSQLPLHRSSAPTVGGPCSAPSAAGAGTNSILPSGTERRFLSNRGPAAGLRRKRGSTNEIGRASGREREGKKV